MKNKLFPLSLVILSASFIISCGQGSDKAEKSEKEDDVTVKSLKSDIKEIDDSLSVLIKKRLEEDDFKIDRLVYHEGINRSIKFYETFPDDDFAPYALEKVASLYDALQISQKSADWRDTIIVNYPEFDRRLDILELQKAHYDNFETYEPEKIEHYIELMLEMDIPDKKREDLEYRLEHIDLTFLEMVKLLNPDLEL